MIPLGACKVPVEILVATTSVINALADVNPVVKLRVAAVTFVETALVFNKVEAVTVVALTLVTCILAAVIPVEAFNVDVLTFVETNVPIVELMAIISVVEIDPELNDVDRIPPATSN